MASEELSLVIHEGNLSVYSRSSKRSHLYLIDIKANGILKKCWGIPQRETNFQCTNGENKINIL